MSKTESSGRNTSGKDQNSGRDDEGKGRQKSGSHHDGRQDFDPEDHPRDESGHFISKDEAESQEENTGRRGKSGDQSGHGGRSGDRSGHGGKSGDHDGREDFDPKEHPRDDSGQFVSKDEAGGQGKERSGVQGGKSRGSGDKDDDDQQRGGSKGGKSSGGAGQAEEHEEAREEMREAARKFALTAPRDDEGRFVSEKEQK